jgi:hypothetical protein
VRHGRVRHNAEDRLDRYETFSSAPATKAHKGLCGCGVETTNMLVVGPPGHPENGWTCRACQELRLQFEMQKADPRRG